ncbi:hypothetical protein cand_008910 [Cryptosporidium andersoni]|uniref:TRIP4/RQT4 C2HC5-type zinc finger domain-containing protein n=1 Tax=Cryptosporidium andersoni TaxID=117008 RepID=A0A1J4MT88_9CRYT|nr:hypothetical protein cand_008910 [Cryptosporidium andersoni]
MHSFRLSDIPTKRQSKTKGKSLDDRLLGNYLCGCYARLHNLYGNCTFCGRIVCELESTHQKKVICLYCNKEVFKTGHKYEIFHENDQSLAAYFEAVDRKDMLLRFVATSKRQTTIRDQDTDWYTEAVNPWSTEEERLYALNMSQIYDELFEKRKTLLNVDLCTGKLTLNEDYIRKGVEYFHEHLSNFVEDSSLNLLESSELVGKLTRFIERSAIEDIKYFKTTSLVNNGGFYKVSDNIWSD